MMYALLIASIVLPSITMAQMTCFQYSGGVISCDGANLSNRTVVPFSNRGGIITDERGRIEPYAILPYRGERNRSMPPAIAFPDRPSRWSDDESRTRSKRVWDEDELGFTR